MNETLQAQIETYLSHLDSLICRGRQVRDALAADPSDTLAIAATRVWQQDCGVTVNQLSGGSKAHWLARSFSEAFLMRSAVGRAVEGAAPAEIVKRLLDVLDQAVASLSRMDDGQAISASSETAPPRRFDFVHNPELRPVVEPNGLGFAPCGKRRSSTPDEEVCASLLEATFYRHKLFGIRRPVEADQAHFGLSYFATLMPLGVEHRHFTTRPNSWQSRALYAIGIWINVWDKEQK